MLCKPIKNIFKKSYHIKLQYISDIHVDDKNYIPHVEVEADFLAIGGDIGKATHPNVKTFINVVSKKFKKVFIVPGNHEYSCSAIYKQDKIETLKPKLINLCNSYDNVFLLDNSCHQLSDNIIIAGTTLWSSCEHILNEKNRIDHNTQHENDVEFIEEICKRKEKIIMMTHYVPTHKLIEPKYLKLGQVNTLFSTNLEHLINKPICAWICGHSHSVIDTNINGIYCGINALGHDNIDCISKVISINNNNE